MKAKAVALACGQSQAMRFSKPQSQVAACRHLTTSENSENGVACMSVVPADEPACLKQRYAKRSRSRVITVVKTMEQTVPESHMEHRYIIILQLPGTWLPCSSMALHTSTSSTAPLIDPLSASLHIRHLQSFCKHPCCQEVIGWGHRGSEDLAGFLFAPRLTHQQDRVIYPR